MNKKIDKKKLIFIVLIILIILLILCLIIFKAISGKDKEVTYEEALSNYKETTKQLEVEDLSGKTENERMKFYCSKFFKYINSKNYEEAYNMLYSEYKENYFPNLASFERYMSQYFSSDVAITYDNIERLGNLYILWINIKDVYNSNNNEFSMNVVIKENAYNDIEMSFSRNSAVDGSEG